jgi:hypothetical protein
MNYLIKVIEDLNLNGIYYTPKEITNEINKVIIGNPPFKTKTK